MTGIAQTGTMQTGITETDLIAGARVLIRQCLAVGAADRVLILTDDPTLPLAEIIRQEAAAHAPCTLRLIGDLDADYPAGFALIATALEELRPSVTIFAARDSGDLLAWDPRFGDMLDALGARHAQMPALDAVSLGQGMVMDYHAVAAFSRQVQARLTGAHQMQITNALGTDIRFALDPARPWIPLTGLNTRPGARGRLPQGEVFCAPLSADGVIAASVLGYPFNAATGLLATPVRFEIAGGRLVGLDHPDRDLAMQLRHWFTRDTHAGRIGELAVGTNPACRALVGNLLHDENVPGCHIAIGHPFGDWTGADWSSAVHVDLVVALPEISVDDRPLIAGGRYVDPSLSQPEGGIPA